MVCRNSSRRRGIFTSRWPSMGKTPNRYVNQDQEGRDSSSIRRWRSFGYIPRGVRVEITTEKVPPFSDDHSGRNAWGTACVYYGVWVTRDTLQGINPHKYPLRHLFVHHVIHLYTPSHSPYHTPTHYHTRLRAQGVGWTWACGSVQEVLRPCSMHSLTHPDIPYHSPCHSPYHSPYYISYHSRCGLNLSVWLGTRSSSALLYTLSFTLLHHITHPVIHRITHLITRLIAQGVGWTWACGPIQEVLRACSVSRSTESWCCQGNTIIPLLSHSHSTPSSLM